MKDEDILPALKAGGDLRRKAFDEIFNHSKIRGAVTGALAAYRQRLENNFPKVERLNLEEKSHVLVNSYVDYFFVEAIKVLDRKIRRDEFRGEGFTQVKAFLAATSKNKCIEWLRRLKPREDIAAQSEQLSVNPEPSQDVRQQVEVLQLLLKKLRNKCRRILMLEAMGYKNEEIAKKLRIKDTNVLKTTKSRCKKQLIGLIEQDEEYLELFHNYLQG